MPQVLKSRTILEITVMAREKIPIERARMLQSPLTGTSYTTANYAKP